MTEKRGKKRKVTARKHNRSSSKKVKKTHKKSRPKSKGIEKVEKEVLKEGKKVEHELEEEFFMPSPRHIGKYKIPLGIKFLIGYLSLILTLYVASFLIGVSFPTTILFGKLVTGSQAMIFNFVLVVLISFMIYGFWKRKWYTFDLAVSFFAFSALNALLSLTLFEAEMPAFRKLMMLSFVSLLFMNVLVIWYVLHERKFFYAKKFHDRPIQQRDKLFMYTIVTFWVVALLVGITLGAQFYKDSKVLVDNSIANLQGNLYEGESICANESGAQKDVCYLVLATARFAQSGETEGLCENIDSDFYKFSCLKSISA